MSKFVARPLKLLQRENFRCTGHATTSIDRGNCWLAALHCTHLLDFGPNSLTVRILNTAVVFSSKSRSGYVLNPDLLSEVDFCRLCGFVFTDKRRKKNKGEFAKMFDSGWCESFVRR